MDLAHIEYKEELGEFQEVFIKEEDLDNVEGIEGLGELNRLTAKGLKRRKNEEAECEHCGQVFSRRFNLKLHIQAKHTERREATEDLTETNDRVIKEEQRVDDKDLEDLHRQKLQEVEDLMEEVVGNIWKCLKCNKRDFKARLRWHVETHVRGLCFRCKHCAKMFNTRAKLNNHLTRNHPDLRDIQVKKTTAEEHQQKLQEVEDLMVEEEGNVWKCLKCDKKDFKSRLRWHVETHVEGLSFQCKECPETFSTRAKLNNHSSRAHADTAKQSEKLGEDYVAECKECGQVFQGPTASKRRSSLMNHIIHVHEGKPRREKKTAVCSQCGKVVQEQYLKKHLLIHEAVPRDKVCEQCGKGFTDATRLMKHISYVHEGKVHEKTTCSYCGKLVSRDYLNHHIQMLHAHAQESDKRFACDQCGKRYGWKSDLTKHVQQVHSSNPDLSCPHCGRKYTKRLYLRHHIHDKHTLEKFNKEDLKKYDAEARKKVVELVQKFDVFQVAEKLMLPVSVLDYWKTAGLCPVCGETVSQRNLAAHLEKHEAGVKAVKRQHERGQEYNSKEDRVREVAHYAKAVGYAQAGKKYNMTEEKVRKFYQVTFHPIQCQYCEYKAPWPNYMKKHILRCHKAVRDNLCHLCDFKAFIYEDLSHHLRQKHQLLTNPHPNRDQIEDIEIVKDNRELTSFTLPTLKASETSPGAVEQSVDPKTRADILERILSLDTELSKLKQEKIEKKVIEKDHDEAEDDPNIEDQETSPEEDQDLSAGENDPAEVESERDGDELNDPFEEEDENDPGVSAKEEKYEGLTAYEDDDLVIRTKAEVKFEEEDQQIDIKLEDPGFDSEAEMEEWTPEEAKVEADSTKLKSDPPAEISPRKAEDLENLSHESESEDLSSEEKNYSPEEVIPRKKRNRKADYLQNWRNAGEKPVCPICQKVLGRGRLNSHLQIHNTERNFICEFCRADFNSKHYLQKHVKRVHQSQEEELPCSYCGEMFSRRSALQKHVMMLHTPAECKLCDRILESQLELKSHMKQDHHTNWTKPGADWFCELCGKVFNSKDGLKLHQSAVHYKEKKSQCPKCGYGFPYVSENHQTFKKHLANCRGVREKRVLACEVCGKIFKKLYNLKVHMTKHTGAKPFSCDLCQKSFVAKRTLIQHREKNHLEHPLLAGS